MDKKNYLLAEEWFSSASSDYQYAQIGLEAEIVFPQVCFLSQQIAEKFLKGFLVYNGVEPPYTHDLPKLLDECAKINVELEKLRSACNFLSGFYIESRYPPDIPEYTKEEILEVFKNAETVKEKIELLIEKKQSLN